MHLSFPVDTDDTISGFMWRCHKDGVSADPVHVDACASFNVIHVDVAILGHQEDHAMFITGLEKAQIVLRLIILSTISTFCTSILFMTILPLLSILFTAKPLL